MTHDDIVTAYEECLRVGWCLEAAAHLWTLSLREDNVSDARQHFSELARLMGYTLTPILDAQSAHVAHEARVLGLNLDDAGNVVGR